MQINIYTHIYEINPASIFFIFHFIPDDDFVETGSK